VQPAAAHHDETEVIKFKVQNKLSPQAVRPAGVRQNAGRC